MSVNTNINSVVNNRRGGGIPLDGVEFNNGKIVIQLDDGYLDNYTVGFPIFQNKGVPATFFVKTGFIGGVDAMTWDNLLTMSDAGMDIQCHTNDYGVMSDGTKEEIEADLAVVNNDFTTNGLPLPEHIAYPGGYVDDVVCDAVDDLRLTGRTVYYGRINRKSSKYMLNTFPINTSVATIKNQLDVVKEEKSAICIYGHRVGETTDGLFVSSSDLAEIIDYGLSIGLDFITLPELYRDMFYMDIRLGRQGTDQINVFCKNKLNSSYSISIERSDDDGETYTEITQLTNGDTDYADTGLTENKVYYYRARAFKGSTYYPYTREAITSTELTYTLTSTGNGTGVSTLSIKVLESVTISIDGAGKFYTNSAGTEGESTSITLTRPSTSIATLIYIKVTSGTANLKISRNGIVSVDGYSAVTNAPSLSGNIANLRKLEVLNISGLNTVSGDISKMTSLTYLKVDGGNTISGDISNLTKLTYIYVKGSNTLSGSITNIIGLTYIDVRGSNTLSGSITDMTDLTLIILIGNNTVTGDVTGKDLKTINITNGSIYGDVTGMDKLTYIYSSSSGNLTGDLSTLPLLTYLAVYGESTFYGDLSIVVENITYLRLYNCGMVDYTGGATWNNINHNAVIINPKVGYGYSSDEINAILIDMANSGFSNRVIGLEGANEGRTSASDAAVSTLQSNGCSLYLN